MFDFKQKTLFLLILFLFTSCGDLNQVSEQIKEIKKDQNLIIQRQSEMIKQISLLDNKIGKSNPSSNKKSNNKQRKGPNPDFVHNIEVGNSVVLGNPNARVTVTKFTDFQ